MRQTQTLDKTSNRCNICHYDSAQTVQMIKLSTQCFAFVVAILSAMDMVAPSTAFAKSQSRTSPSLQDMHKSASDYRVDRIRGYLKSGNIDIPESVINQIEAIIIEAVVVESDGRNERGRLHKLWRDKHSLYDQDFSSPSLYEKYVRRLRQEEKDYFASQTYKELKQQRYELREQALQLLDPYFDSILAPKPQSYSSSEPVDMSHLTVEEQVKHRVERYRKIYEDLGFPMSEEDLRSLEAPIRELIPLGRRSKALTRDKISRDSPEFEQLRLEVREARIPLFQILAPYMEKYPAQKAAYQAKQNVISELKRLATPSDLMSPEDILDRDFERVVRRYARKGIMMSSESQQDLKGLMSEKAPLLEEMDIIRLGRGLEYDPNSIEVFNLKSSLAEIEDRLQAILKPYDSDLEAVKRAK